MELPKFEYGQFINSSKNEAEQTAVKAFCQALNVAYEEEPQAENYNPEFLAKIKRSEDDFSAGRVYKVNLEDIWK